MLGIPYTFLLFLPPSLPLSISLFVQVFAQVFLADRIVRDQDINRGLYEREEEDSERGL